jgi:drug/metabolite transporter (DMT)-like permease
MTRLQADLLLLLGAAIWGYAFVFQKTAMEHVGPYTFIAARSIVAALALAPLAWRETRAAGGTLPPGLSRIALIAGAAFFLGAALQQFGLLTATVTNTGFLTAL